MKKKYKGAIYAGALFLLSTNILMVATYAWFTAAIVNDDTGVKSNVFVNYFDSGSGTAADPFVITRPIHYYNLTYLNLTGAFGTDKYYFQIGKEATAGSGDYYTYGTDDGTTLDQSILDMASSANHGNVRYASMTCLGTQSAPFFGEIDGNNIVVKNLSVHGDPEDVGVFGYVESGAKISNMLFSDLDIYDDGYTPSLSSFYTGTYTSSLTVGGVSVGTEATVIGSGALSFNLPASDSSVAYSSLGSSSYYTRSSATSYVFNKDLFDNNSDFNSSTESTSASIRIYLLATTNVNDMDYTHVIDTYTITITHDKTRLPLGLMVSRPSKTVPIHIPMAIIRDSSPDIAMGPLMRSTSIMANFIPIAIPIRLKWSKIPN